jgi:hypothetical protein
MSSIEKSASRLRVGVLIGWALLVLVHVAGRLGLAAGSLRFEVHSPGGSALGPLVTSDVTLLLLSIALFRLVQMLNAISASQELSAAAVRAFRGFAFWLFVLALFGLAAPIVPELVRAATSGDRIYAFPIAVRNVLTVAVALVLFLVARLLERARAAEEELREIV